MHTKINIPEHVIEQVRIAYRDYPYAEKNVIQIANEYGFNPSEIYNQIRKFGIIQRTKRKHQRRCEMEKEIICKNLDKKDITICRILKKKGYHWTESELASFRAHRRWSFKNGHNYLLVSQFAQGLGITDDTILKAIRDGHIKADVMEKNATNFHPYKIKFSNAKKFIINNVVNINFQYVDKYFIVNLLTDRL